MNSKPDFSSLIKVAPPLIFVAGIVYLVDWFLTDEKAKQKSEIKPASGIPPKPKGVSTIPPVSISKPNIPIFQNIRTEIPNPFSSKRRLVTREDVKAVFQSGPLSKTEAVDAFKRLGFSKSAAYQALEQNGRFAILLQFAPDGIITWRDWGTNA